MSALRRRIDAARRPSGPHLHTLWPLRLHGRRQSRGGGIFRAQCQIDSRQWSSRRSAPASAACRASHIFGSAQQNDFNTCLLDSIAVVVGGTSLFGGRGGIGSTLVGLFVLGILNNGLDRVNIDSFLKILIRGVILLAALVINV